MLLPPRKRISSRRGRARNTRDTMGEPGVARFVSGVRRPGSAPCESLVWNRQGIRGFRRLGSECQRSCDLAQVMLC
jgi:hypothetical protein